MEDQSLININMALIQSPLASPLKRPNYSDNESFGDKFGVSPLAKQEDVNMSYVYSERLFQAPSPLRVPDSFYEPTLPEYFSFNFNITTDDTNRQREQTHDMRRSPSPKSSFTKNKSLSPTERRGWSHQVLNSLATGPLKSNDVEIKDINTTSAKTSEQSRSNRLSNTPSNLAKINKPNRAMEEEKYQSLEDNSEDTEITTKMPGRKKKLTKTQKREKNKEKAKNCRLRKKDYISTLEKKVATLEAENKRLREELSVFTEMMKMELINNEDSTGKFKSTCYDLLKILQKTIYQRTNNKEVDTIMLNFRDNCEEVVEERKTKLKVVFNSVIDMILPEFTKLVLWTVEENKGLFKVDKAMKLQQESNRNHHNKSLNYTSQLNVELNEWNEFVGILGLSNEQQKKISQHGVWIRQGAKRLRESIEKLLHVKNEIFDRIQYLDNAIYVHKRILTHDQAAKYMLWLEENSIREANGKPLLYLKPSGAEVKEDKSDEDKSDEDSADSKLLTKIMSAEHNKDFA